MKSIIIRQSRWDEIFEDWLRKTAPLAEDERHQADRNWSRFLNYHVHDLKKRLEEAE